MRDGEVVGKVVGISLLLAGVFIAGCGGGSGSSGPIALADLGPAVVSADCSLAVRCGLSPDEATCKASTTASTARITAQVNAGQLRYDGQAAATCIDAAAAQPCDRTTRESTATPRACVEALAGLVPIGGACVDSQTCTSNNCDTSTCTGTTCCMATCAAAAATTPQGSVGAGGNCTFGQLDCDASTFCRDTSSGGATCVPRLAAGMPCNILDGQLTCATGSLCLASGPQAGTCGRLPAEGAACDSGFGCDSSLDYCDPVTATCLHQIAVGGPCPNQTGCVPYARCDATTLTCVMLGKAGDPCDPTQFPPCLGNLGCVSGVCAAAQVDTTCI
jgi:hypothetical protein